MNGNAAISVDSVEMREEEEEDDDEGGSRMAVKMNTASGSLDKYLRSRTKQREVEKDRRRESMMQPRGKLSLQLG